MDTLDNIKTFLLVARTGSFSAAARQLGVVPSVITKRIDRLEDQMKARLFTRSTRQVLLTSAGEHYVTRYQVIVADIEEALSGASASSAEIQGHLRIKAPTTLAIQRVGKILTGFQLAHPAVSVELVMLDRSVNPIEEGFDIAIGALPASFANVIDEPLCAYPRVICASPQYLDRHGEPQHPHDLIDHPCLTFLTTGSTWSFESARGAINVDVHVRFSANDSEVLRAAACRGLGIARIAKTMAEHSLQSGELKALLLHYPVTEFWVKALVPRHKLKSAPVRALLQALKEGFQARPEAA